MKNSDPSRQKGKLEPDGEPAKQGHDSGTEEELD